MEGKHKVLVDSRNKQEELSKKLLEKAKAIQVAAKKETDPTKKAAQKQKLSKVMKMLKICVEKVKQTKAEISATKLTIDEAKEADAVAEVRDAPWGHHVRMQCATVQACAVEGVFNPWTAEHACARVRMSTCAYVHVLCTCA
jgi:hypothetical protein